MEPFALSTPDGTLVLDVPTVDDVDRITAICQDPEIQRFTSVPSPYEREDAKGFVSEFVTDAWAKGAPVWAVRTVDDAGRTWLVGMIDLHDVQHRRAEIGYWLAPEARGRGIMSRAVGLVLDAAFGVLAMRSIRWCADVENWTSWRVAWRHGFRKEGTVRDLVHVQRGWRDGWIGSLRNDDPREPAAPWDGPGATPSLSPADADAVTAPAADADADAVTAPAADADAMTAPAADAVTAPAADAAAAATTAWAAAAPSPRDPDALVRQFHATYNLPVVADAPSVDRDRVHMRMALVAEETAELVEAVYGEAAGAEMSAAFTRAVAADDGTRDTVEAADALGDLTYVVYGMALECGIPLDEVLAEIQASNLSKLGADGRPIYREDGKVLKGPGFFSPDVAGVLARHGYRPRG